MDQFENDLREKIEASPTPEARREILKEMVERKVSEQREILEKMPERKEVFAEEVGREVQKFAFLEKTEKIEMALKLAEEDLFKAIAAVRQSNDPWLEDTFHDELIKNYEKLILSGQLKKL